MSASASSTKHSTANESGKSRSHGTSPSKSRNEGGSKHEKGSSKKRRCHEQCCDKCASPSSAEKRKEKRDTPCKSLAQVKRSQYRIRTEIDFPGVGAIPVLKGDPKWLPGKARDFIAEKALLMTPAAIYICNGSTYEAREIIELLKKQGGLESVDGHLVRTDPVDKTRIEMTAYINHSNAGAVLAGDEHGKSALINFMRTSKMESELDSRFDGCMKGRIMFVIPFSLGSVCGSTSLHAVQLTDSPYAVLNMRIMTRISSSVWDMIGDGVSFARLIHSSSIPDPSHIGHKRSPSCSVERPLLVHRLEENEVWCFGNDHGDNSLIGEKAVALRLASWIGKKQGWLAEHAALLSVTDPNGNESFITFHASAGGGKTTLALLEPTLPGWKIGVLGDDITWIRQGKDGKLYAMAPECGIFGNKDALSSDATSIMKNRCSQNVMESNNSQMINDGHRFTISTEYLPNLHPQWDSPKGVPLTAMIFCSRRSDAYPLCFESDGWNEGVTLAAAMRSELDLRSRRKVSTEKLVVEPMGMRAYLSYNFAHYVRHWIEMGKSSTQAPKIFHVNWYRASENNEPLWPGYGENIRILEWILRRCARAAIASIIDNPENSDGHSALKVPGGYVPTSIESDEGIDVTAVHVALTYDHHFWRNEVSYMKEFFTTEMGTEAPKEVLMVVSDLEKQLVA